MRELVIALTVVGALAAGCDDTPDNKYAAGCLKVLRQDRGILVFGAKTKPFTEAFCACFGDEMEKTRAMSNAGKARTLDFLTRFDGSKDDGVTYIAIGRYLNDLNDGKAELVAIVGRCQDRLSK